MTRTVVIRPDIFHSKNTSRHPERGLQEAVALAKSIDLLVVDAKIIKIRRLSPSTLFGTGIIRSLAESLDNQKIELVIVDGKLSPTQQRKLETEWKCKVIDRTGIILEIFQARANTHEGRLQVELAALDYQRSRLVRAWTHLERQRGGRGFLAGPGESQIESDRRQIDQRRSQIRANLDKVVKTRHLQRAPREKIPLPLVALVGYTNAGKSTLFNRLTTSNTYTANQLFATLDPKMCKVVLPSGSPVILSDTVGFIGDIPTELIAAFRATLEELYHASIFLHVRDFSDPDNLNQKRDVQKTLKELGIEDGDSSVKMIQVLNKIDLLRNSSSIFDLDADKEGENVVSVSSKTGQGCDKLLTAIDAILMKQRQIFNIKIPMSEGSALAWLYRNGAVLSRKEEKADLLLKVSMEPGTKAKFQSNFGSLSLKSTLF